MKKFLDVLPGYKTYGLGVLGLVVIFLAQQEIIPLELANLILPYVMPLMGVTLAMKVDRNKTGGNI